MNEALRQLPFVGMCFPWPAAACVVILWSAGPGDVRGGDEQSPVEVTVLSADGDVIEGRLQSLAEDLRIELEPDRTRSLERRQIVHIRRSGAARPAVDVRSQPLALLVNGDVLVGLPVRLADDLLWLEFRGASPPQIVEVPLEFVRAIVLAHPDDGIEQQRLQRQWGLPRAGSDRLLLKNRTTIEGELEGMDGRDVLMSTSLGPVSTPRDEIAALTLNADLASQLPASEESAILLCANGSRISLRETTIDTSMTISGTAAFGGKISVPLEEMVGLQLFGERVQPVAGRAPHEFAFTPFLSREHPLVSHRNILGGPLRLRGVRFATGLGMSSRSEVTYDLGEEDWKSFRTTIGVDDLADGGGHVVFRVALDGETVYDSGDLSGRDDPLEVGPIDVTAARRLTLIVDYGRAGNIRDFANWCDPLLLR